MHVGDEDLNHNSKVDNGEADPYDTGTDGMPDGC